MVKSRSFKTGRKILSEWIKLVNNKNARKVAELYHPNSILLPTFSPHALKTFSGKLAYFKSLGSRKRLKVSLHPKTFHRHSISPSHEVISGIYRFSFEIDHEPMIFEARFCMALNLQSTTPILHHHSSQIPRTLN